MRATIIASIYGACGVTLLMFYAAHQWLDPLLPMVVGLVAIALPALGIVLALERDAHRRRTDPLIIAQAALIAALFGVGVPSTWKVPSVRAAVLQHLPPSTGAIQRAFEDPAPKVRLAACTMMFDGEESFPADDATAALFEHPQVANRCLREVENQDAAARTTRKLAGLWHATLRGGDEKDCEHVEPLDNLPITKSARATLLLDCSLRAEAPAVRSCCAQRLTTAHPGDELFTSLTGEGSELLQELGASGALVAASFGEETFIASTGNVARTLSLEQERYRRFAAQAACTAALQGSDPGSAISYLRWLFETSDACLSEEQAAAPIDVRSSCTYFLESQKDERTEVTETLCRANQAVQMQSAAEIAAVRSDNDFGSFAESIELGRATRAGSELSAGNLQELMESGRLHGLSADERMALSASLGELAHQTADQTPPEGTQGEGRESVARLQTEGGREKMQADYMKQMKEQNAVVEQALGISAEEFSGGVEEDGKLSEELEARIEKAKARAAKRQ